MYLYLVCCCCCFVSLFRPWLFVYKRVSSTHYSVYGLWSCCSSTVSRAGRVTRARAPAQLPRGARDSSQSQLSKLTKPQKPFLTDNKVENKRAYRLIFKKSSESKSERRERTRETCVLRDWCQKSIPRIYRSL